MKKLIKFYQRLTFLQGTAFAISILAVAGLSAHSLTPFNVFTPGQTISASAVNTNFNTLADAIEANSTMTYLGVWDANGALPTASMIGDYYIVNVAGGVYLVNDKIVWNGTTFDRVPADNYWTKVVNDISYDAGNVSVGQKLRLKSASTNYVELKAPSTLPSTYVFTFPSNPGTPGKVLATDGTGNTSWVTLTDPNVQSFALTGLPTCAVGEVLKSNGVVFSCVTDNAGTAFSGSPSKAVATDGGGALVATTVTATELGYVSGVTSAIQTQLNAKLASGTFVDWSASGVQTIDPSRLNLTMANRVAVTNGTGFLTASSIDTTKLGYLSNVTADINTQLTNKANNSSPTFTGSVTSPFYSATAVSAANNTSYRGSTADTGIFFPTGTSVAIAQNGTEVMSFAGGNVGIGITNPTSDFEVAGNAKISGKILIADGTAAQPSLAYGGGQNTGLWSPGSGALAISSSGSEKFRLSPSGNVGIGASVPAYKLDVGTSSDPSNVINVNASSSGRAELIANADGMASIHLTTNFTGSPFQGLPPSTTGIIVGNSAPFVMSISNGEKFRIQPSGNIGIGTNNPAAILDIMGTGNASAIVLPRDTNAARPSTPIAGMLRYNNTANDLEFYNGTAWTTISVVSDARLKTNIVNVENGLGLVKKLRPVFFDWDQNVERAKTYGTKHQVGFLAQEVEKVIPEVVTKAKDTFRTMEYGKIVAVVVSAVQELSTKFDSLQARFSSRDREMEFIKAENKMMKNYLCTRDPMAPFCEQ